MNWRSILLTSVCCLMFTNTLGAEGVFKWTDESGVTHYSSKEPFKGAKQAKLPNIMRAEVKVPKLAGESCTQHGGVNCPAGPDGDGSVICTDGYSGSTARFIFTCNSPKLGVMQIGDIAADGSVKVVVRNSKSVKADKPILIYKPQKGKEITVEGPEQIDGFAVAEFTLKGAGAGFTEKPALEDLTISCVNCPS